ncbi:hypothetical protein GUJ93_ZPchr0004g40308 [Zizania palustris]|uniref:Uncharacterized protein n=1 Tax=Zizania palustris TaxID=103762 RepID=A0A8J5SNN7_ZIZPA|nr:hypothetical protein GUJ93_ZPchr0004g40308 [Zizania palustris]
MPAASRRPEQRLGGFSDAAGHQHPWQIRLVVARLHHARNRVGVAGLPALPIELFIAMEGEQGVDHLDDLGLSLSGTVCALDFEEKAFAICLA